MNTRTHMQTIFVDKCVSAGKLILFVEISHKTPLNRLNHLADLTKLASFKMATVTKYSSNIKFNENDA